MGIAAPTEIYLLACCSPSILAVRRIFRMSWDSKVQLGYSSADAKRLLIFLLAFETLLVFNYCVVHILAPDFKWGPLMLFVDMNRESAIPTWFSTVQLFAIAVLLLFLAQAAKQLRRYLIVFGLGFMFLSMDEAAVIHEKIIDSAKRLDWQWLLSLTFGGSHQAWMIPYLVLALIVILICYRFFILAWQSFRQEALIVAAGLALFGVGGIGLELLGFYFEDHPSETPYAWAVAGEEFLEMAGMTVVLYGSLLLGIKFQSGSLD